MTFGKATMTAATMLMLASCSTDAPPHNSAKDYASAMPGSRTVAISTEEIEEMRADDMRIHKNRLSETRYKWIKIPGPQGAMALINGGGKNGVVSFMWKPQDKTNFLMTIYQGSCRTGWKPLAKTLVLGTYASTAGIHPRIATPSLPWVENSLRQTCTINDSTPSLTLNGEEAMIYMMGGRIV